LSVFDAEHLADGPLAQASLPYVLPLGLHGQFVAG
jgi:carotenoid cleavage dioxygenase